MSNVFKTSRKFTSFFKTTVSRNQRKRRKATNRNRGYFGRLKEYCEELYEDKKSAFSENDVREQSTLRSEIAYAIG